jgi:hypothetical protein
MSYSEVQHKKHNYHIRKLTMKTMPFTKAKEALSLGVKRLGREANHSPSSVDITNEWSYTSISPCGYTACKVTTFPFTTT